MVNYERCGEDFNEYFISAGLRYTIPNSPSVIRKLIYLSVFLK